MKKVLRIEKCFLEEDPSLEQSYLVFATLFGAFKVAYKCPTSQRVTEIKSVDLNALSDFISLAEISFKTIKA